MLMEPFRVCFGPEVEAGNHAVLRYHPLNVALLSFLMEESRPDLMVS